MSTTPTEAQVINTPTPENPSPPPPSSPSNKKPFIILGIVVIGTLLLGSAYFLGKSQNKIPSTPPPPSISPTSTTSPTPYPTLNWKTYSNTQYKYSFKYPSNFIIQGINMGPDEINAEIILADKNKVSESYGRLNYPFLRVTAIFDLQIPLQDYAQKSLNQNKDNSIISSKLQSYSNGYTNGWFYEFSGKSFDTLQRNGEGRNNGDGFVIDYNGKLKSIFFENNNNLIVIITSLENPLDQILSTFKFTTQ